MSDLTSCPPDFFKSSLKEQYGIDEAQRILDGCSVTRNVTLRANTLKASATTISHALDESELTWSSPQWYRDAFVLEDARERDIWKLGPYKEGRLYLQSLSSMIPALVLNARPGDDVLDMCAAPGGKTTQIAALADNKAYITAVEMHAPRAEKLKHNLDKLGARNVTLMQTDSRRLDDFFSFDRILLDAPCSGSGTLNFSHTKTKGRFTPKLVEKSIKAQRALLDKALRLLKPGGTLVYSTCSVLACENEERVIDSLKRAGKHASFEVKPIDGFGANDIPRLACGLEGALCLCPTELYEGFFVAHIERTA